MENKRESFRVIFPLPIKGNLTILEVNGETINSGSTAIDIMDVSSGGARFYSHLHFIKTDKIVYLIEFNLSGENFACKGNIVRRVATDDHFVYGCAFQLNEDEFRGLATACNKYEIGRRKELASTGSR